VGAWSVAALQHAATAKQQDVDRLDVVIDTQPGTHVDHNTGAAVLGNTAQIVLWCLEGNRLKKGTGCQSASRLDCNHAGTSAQEPC